MRDRQKNQDSNPGLDDNSISALTHTPTQGQHLFLVLPGATSLKSNQPLQRRRHGSNARYGFRDHFHHLLAVTLGKQNLTTQGLMFLTSTIEVTVQPARTDQEDNAR